MKHLIYIVSIIFLLSACKTAKQTTQQNNDIIITLSKTAGRGIGPVYTINIYSNGDAVLIAKKNMKLLGTYSKKLSSKELDIIIDKFNNADFFSFQDEYTALITDLATTYISYTAKGKTKKIRDYHGTPEELKALESHIEEIVKQEGWSPVE